MKNKIPLVFARSLINSLGLKFKGSNHEDTVPQETIRSAVISVLISKVNFPLALVNVPLVELFIKTLAPERAIPLFPLSTIPFIKRDCEKEITEPRQNSTIRIYFKGIELNLKNKSPIKFKYKSNRTSALSKTCNHSVKKDQSIIWLSAKY